MDLAVSLRIQARANRLANYRLHAAMAPLPRNELHAPRSGFFPSLIATLNHIVAVDQYYVGALLGEPVRASHWDDFVPDDDLPPLAQRQRASDERLMAFCDVIDSAGYQRVVEMPRSQGRIQRDAAAHVLAHLFMHQTHHRGQVHAMLSSTSVAPPQLDEFLLPSEPHLRLAEMAALGWDEAAIYGSGSRR